jgi:two-component system CheB/CheR fusion protein
MTTETPATRGDGGDEARTGGIRTPVVGIGASAGGLAAAEAFFRGLPASPGMAFVVIQHLAPDHESEMAELLQNHTALLVAQAEDGQRVEANHVYTIPPGRQLTVDNGVLRLSPAAGRRGHVQSPIDLFFRSLATDQGSEATCVILSGTGTDGTLGLRAIKEAGGLTLVQAPADAEYDGMPRSAVGTGLADIVGPAAELAERLVEFRDSADLIDVPEEPGALPEDSSAALSRIFAKLRDRAGHDFSHYKRSSILRRVGRRLQVHGLPDLPSYLTFVRENPEELDALFKDLLISVTNFFRDPDAWSALAKQAIPGVLEGKTDRDTVRVWVPGCATGEEAYTLAMLLCDRASRMEDPPRILVFATDIDDGALTFAREGIYPEAIAGDLPEDYRERYLERAAGGFRVSKAIREMVLFAPHNILQDAPFSRQDMISCRNLLIYLSREVQETIFEVFHYALRQDGYLFLGSSESAEGADRLFGVIDKRHRVYQRRSTPSRVPVYPTIAAADLGPVPARDARDHLDRSVAERHRDRLIRERVPPTLLVDSDYEIRHIAGGAHRFLRDVDGVPSRDLLDKILPALRLDLRAALFQALQSREAVRTSTSGIELDGERLDVLIEVVPLDEKAFEGRFAEVVFTVRDPSKQAGPDRPATPVDKDVASQLEEELDRTRERLQTVIEEYETSNEELKASNEELQSMNEELRSTTEELETSREELQSMNEELVTVNQELRAKIDELGRANSDLNNLMGSTEIGTIFLDRELRIKRYTPAAEALFHLQPADVGRPLRALTQKLGPDDLVELAKEVLEQLSTIEREMKGEDGEWYITRIRPYRTVDDAIDGVVMTFMDVTALKNAERQARFQADVLAQVHDAVIATDLEERVIYLNAAASRRFGLDPDAAIGSRLSQLLDVHYPTATSKAEAEAALEARGEWRGEVEYRIRDGRRYDIEARISALNDDDGERIGSLGVLRDVTDRKQAEALAHERQQYLETSLRNVPIVAAITDTDLRYRWIYQPHPDFDPTQAVGKRDDELDPDDPGVEDLMQLKREVLHHQESLTREIRFHRSDGDRIYEMTVDPMYDAEGRVVGLKTAGLDITERLEREDELRVAKQAAEAANASKAAFLAAMSHELRTPLNAITGYVDLMELGVPDDLTAAQRRQVDRIKVSARHLRQLIEEILQFARVDAGQESYDIAAIQLADLVEEVRAILLPLAEKQGIEFRVTTDQAPETVRSDPRKLRQILLNLLGNAVKFTEKGRVELRIDPAEDGHLRFHVIDTGKGMVAEEIDHIFEPFWQSDSSLTREAGGSGLGLAISKRYVEMLGGDISVRSAPGSGSAFTVVLPTDGRSESPTPSSEGARIPSAQSSAARQPISPADGQTS